MPAPVVAHPARNFMTVKQVAEYLHLNEKKVYSLANDGGIPATKVTGKWVFPRELVDRWLLESSHGGMLSDRLLLVGGDDPLLHRALQLHAYDHRAHNLLSHSVCGTRLGLELLARGRADICAMHWGPAAESATRHPALLRQHSAHRQWVLVHGFCREQGLLLSPDLPPLTRIEELFAEPLRQPLRWATRDEDSGSQRLLREALARRESMPAVEERHQQPVRSEREAAGLLAMGELHVAPGSRAAASEYGLGFLSLGWVSVDFALPRGVYFRHLFQGLMARLGSAELLRDAERLGGYDFDRLGALVWSQE